MKKDCGLEVLPISEATNAMLDRHDFAVHACGDSICHTVRAEVYDILQPLFDRASHSLQWHQYCVDHAFVPVREVRGG